MDRGYIKSWRKIIDSPVFQDEHLLRLWIWCIHRAAYKYIHVSVNTGGGNVVVNLSPGQFIFGRKSVASILKWKESTTWDRMKKLEALGMIALKSDTHFTVVSVVNWDTYQADFIDEQQPGDSPVTARQQPGDSPVTQRRIYKKEKNINKEKKEEETYMSVSKKTDSCPHQEIINLYHELLPELPRVVKWTDKRKAHLKTCWAEESRQTLEWWREYFADHVRTSDFLMGRTDLQFVCNLEWLTMESRLIKILEGNYKNRVKEVTSGINKGNYESSGKRRGGFSGRQLYRDGLEFTSSEYEDK